MSRDTRYNNTDYLSVDNRLGALEELPFRNGRVMTFKPGAISGSSVELYHGLNRPAQGFLPMNTNYGMHATTINDRKITLTLSSDLTSLDDTFTVKVWVY